METIIQKYMQQRQKGFTLLEVLLVVAIIGILAGIVILAINPTKQLADSRNAQRQADVNTIMSAVYQHTIDNKGTSLTLPATATEICATSGCSGGLIDLSTLTASGKYLVALPVDPSGAIAVGGNGYKISQDATTKRVTVAATQAEQGATISISR